MGVRILAVLMVAAIVASCASSTVATEPVPEHAAATTTTVAVSEARPTPYGPEPPERVPAEDVRVIGHLDVEQARLIDWALGRFSLAGIGLPAELEVVYDPTRAACLGDTGRCLMPNGMPRLYICRPVGVLPLGSIELTVLHELAHIWHWSHGAGRAWPDDSAIVGGVPNAPDDTPWEQRTEERVAMIVSWGLADPERRFPVLPLTCDQMRDEFVALTGTGPLGPLPAECSVR